MNLAAQFPTGRHSTEWRGRAIASVLSLALASLLLHAVVLAWVDGTLATIGDGPPASTVTVSLIVPATLPDPPPVPKKVVPLARAPLVNKQPIPKRVVRKPAAHKPIASGPPAPGAISASPAGVSAISAEPMVPVSPDAFGAPLADEPGQQAVAPPTAEPQPDPASRQPSSRTAEPEPAQAAAPAAPPPLPAPPQGKWRFGVYYGDYTEGHEVATLDYSIQLQGERYRLATEGRASGLTALFYSGVLTQTSEGRITTTGLAPERYTEKRGKRPERSLRVDRDAGQVLFTGKNPEPIVEGAQDRLSVLVQLGLLARAHPERFAPQAVIKLPELSVGDLVMTSYTVHAVTTLPAQNGTIRALYLERTAPRKDGDNRVEIWLGYDLHLIPVRIRITDVGGRVLDQMLSAD